MKNRKKIDEERIDKDIKKIMIIFLIVFLIIFVFMVKFIVKDIFLSSYNSLVYNCQLQNRTEFLEENNLSLGGLTTVKFSPSGNVTNITIQLFTTDKKILKHEWVHVRQVLQRRSNSCQNLIGVYINEVEANFAEYLPDNIYNRIYGIPFPNSGVVK
ncbi:MAG: hypothetical protein AABY22_09645 [Nanoarchaeota archaeon]